MVHVKIFFVFICIIVHAKIIFDNDDALAISNNTVI